MPRDGLGTFPIRFPHPDDPGDAGWHVDAGYMPEGEPGGRVTLRSRGRALLMLFLFSDVDADSAPTRIKVGSHLDVPAFLEPDGEHGMRMFALCRLLQPVPLGGGRGYRASGGNGHDGQAEFWSRPVSLAGQTCPRR